MFACVFGRKRAGTPPLECGGSTVEGVGRALGKVRNRGLSMWFVDPIVLALLCASERVNIVSGFSNNRKVLIRNPSETSKTSPTALRRKNNKPILPRAFPPPDSNFGPSKTIPQVAKGILQISKSVVRIAQGILQISKSDVRIAKGILHITKSDVRIAKAQIRCANC